MSVKDNAILTLTQLGLTFLESKVYIILCKYGKLSTKEISKFGKMAQSDVYRVVKSLQHKGLIQKQIQKPAIYKATPFKTGSAFLLERKKSNYDKLERKIEQLNLQFKENSTKPRIDEESEFLMVPKRENIVKKINEAIDRSKKRVDLCLTWQRFYNGMTHAFAESSEKAWARGVQFRIVLEAPQETLLQKKAEEFCRKSPMCSIRFIPSSPKTVMGLYDEKEVFIVVKPNEGLFQSPALWSSNQSLITALQECFDLLWLTSMKEPNQNSA